MLLQDSQTPDNSDSAVHPDGWGISFAQSIQQKRSHSLELLTAERERIRRMEVTITDLMTQVGEDLKASESQMLAELAMREEVIAGLQRQMEQQQVQFDRLMAEAVALYRPSPEVEEELQRLRVALAESTRQHEAQTAALDELRAQLGDALRRPPVVQQDEKLVVELEALRAEQARLESLLAKSQNDSAESHGDSAEALQQLQKRYDLVLSDLRELKTRNAELERKLAAKSSTIGSAAPSLSLPTGNDWASQKQRLLAQLEAESTVVDAGRKEARLEIEEVIRSTDKILAEKDAEIAGLRQLLQEQSSKIGEVAVGASAIAGLLDQDELIRQERETLKKLESDWREKLRQAEVDLSMERAKIARERALLDERIQQFESERAKLPDGDDKKGGNKAGRGRWMTRLGLSDKDT
jgi:CheY-like chemotaxis protein